MTRVNFYLRRGVLLVMLLAGGLLAACTAPPVVLPATSQFQIATDKTDNVVTVAAEGDRLLVDVQSASGIGNAGVRAAEGTLPPVAVMRFHLAGLEQMTFAFGDVVVKLSIPSSGDQPALQSVVEAGQESPITPESPYWMEVTRPAAADGVFEVISPPAYAASPPANFTVGWIDFYR